MEAIWSTAWDGKNRRLYKLMCLSCSKEMLIPKHRLQRTKTCSTSCRDLHRKSGKDVCCIYCGKPAYRKLSKLSKLSSKSGLTFCSRVCKDTAQRWEHGLKAMWPDHYGNGTSGYRIRAFRERDKVCIGCGYKDDSRMLDVDHIDSNRSNNKIDNLQVLCVWCHALKTRCGKGFDRSSIE